jgi:two-component system nitrate/nitrite response regulator NarL
VPAASTRARPSNRCWEMGTADPIRVAVVADTRVCADALGAVLDRDESVDVVTTGMWPECLEEVRRRKPEIVLLHLGHEDGIPAAQAVRRRLPARVVALAVPETERAVISYAEAGISAYLAREGSLDELATVVKATAQGEAVSTPRIVAALLERVAALAAISRDVGALTPRERQVLRLLDEGLSNKEIAERLCIEASTVKNHVHRILKKLAVSRRAEAVAALRVSRAPHDGGGARRASTGPPVPAAQAGIDQS